MRGYLKTLAGCSVWARATTALYHVPVQSVTTTHSVDLVVRQESALPEFDVGMAAIVPTDAGQIGINPPKEKPTPANIENIEIHQDYFSVGSSTTKWIGVDTWFAVATTTVTQGEETAVATITKGVSTHKSEDGGIDIVLSPGVKAKLEAIAKEVTPCSKKRRRNLHNRKRQAGPACGFADFRARVNADEELRNTFSEALTDQVRYSQDSGVDVGDPADDPGWEGDGDAPGIGDGEGYFTDDDSGFFDVDGAGEGEGTMEAIIFSSEEEAAAIEAALAGVGAGDAAVIWGGSTVTATSFLAWLWGTLQSGDELDYAQHIPSESIHTITKTKSEDEGTPSTTTSADSCPTPTGEIPTCETSCQPTSVKYEDAEATGVVAWSCSEGDSKGCICNPGYEEVISTQNADFQQVIEEALAAIDEEPPEAITECPGDFSPVPSEFFLDHTSKGFCEEVMKDLEKSRPPVAMPYTIYGANIPHLRLRGTDMIKRTPPENIDNYADYLFFLGYEHQDGECLVDKEDLCRNAYEKLVRSNCGTNHGSAGNRMAKKASVDVGCGKFTWEVQKRIGTDPPPKITFGERKCHERHDHPDVHAPHQDQWSHIGCKWYAAGKTMKAGDKEIYWTPPAALPDAYQSYRISWIEGCDIVDEQDVWNPLPDDENITCGVIMNNNYHKCNNGGAGGVVDVGCLRYDFFVRG